jgi:hypothetical protein
MSARIEDRAMRPRTRAVSAGPILPLILLLGLCTPAMAQTPDSSTPGGGVKWSVVNGIGFGGLGFGLGIAVAWNMESNDYGPPDAAIVITGASTVTGILLGAMTGIRAQNKVAAGQTLHGAHRVAVIGGGIAAGGTLGALSAVPLINGEGEGTFLGSDEQTFALLVVAGSALGALYVWGNRAELTSRNISLTPEFTENRQYGLRVRMEVP